jgi:hypothetical protein
MNFIEVVSWSVSPADFDQLYRSVSAIRPMPQMILADDAKFAHLSPKFSTDTVEVTYKEPEDP